MNLGIVTHTDKSLEEQLYDIGGSGLDHAEIYVGGHNSNIEYLEKNISDLNRIKDEYDLNFYFHLPIDSINIGSQLERVRKGSIQALKRILGIGKDLNVEKAVIHPSGVSKFWRKEKIDETIINSIEELNKISQNYEIELLVENLSRGNFKLKDLKDLIERTNANICLDTGHANLTTDDVGIFEFINSFEDEISHIHLNDNRGGYDEHIPIGYGNVNFENIILELKDIGWDGSLSMELVTKNFEYHKYCKKYMEKWI